MHKYHQLRQQHRMNSCGSRKSSCSGDNNNNSNSSS
jgi:hypothetical protein